MKKYTAIFIGSFVLIICAIFIGACDDAGVITPSVTPGKYNRSFKAGASDIMTSMSFVNDDGLVLGGYSSSIGAGGNDFYATRLSSAGDVLWSKAYGQTGNEMSADVEETQEGGYIMAGNTTSTGANGSDILLVKTDANGNLQWAVDYVIPGDQFACSVVQTADFGYLVCGYSNENPGSNNDILILKVNSTGNFVSENLYGSPFNDIAYKMIKTSDGGFLVAGATYGFSGVNGDIYLLKIKSDMSFDWSNTYGGDGYDQANSVVETSGHDFMIVGYTKSYGLTQGSMILFKTDHNGNVYTSEGWPRTIGDSSGFSEATSVLQETDNSFLISGYTTNAAGATFVSFEHYFNNSVFDYSRSYGPTTDNYKGVSMISIFGNFAVIGGNRTYGAGINDFFVLGMPDSSGKYVACLNDNGFNLKGGSPATFNAIAAPTQSFPPAAETDLIPTLQVTLAGTIKSVNCGQ